MSEILSERVKKPDDEKFDPHSVVFVTTTFYPGWHGAKRGNTETPDQVRGDLALHTLQAAKESGMQVLVIDGAQNEEFKEALRQVGIEPRPEVQRGMSPSRMQGFKEASVLPSAKAILWTEPEKVSIVEDGCWEKMVAPVLSGEADVVVPKRDYAAFATYPGYQTVFEERSNRRFNAILRAFDLRDENEPDLDVWFGPRVFRNTPELVGIFTTAYEYTPQRKLDERAVEREKVIRPDLWPNATFFPVIKALHDGYTVASVEVDYRHPAIQTETEMDSPVHKQKRDVQHRGIVRASADFARFLKGGSSISGMNPISS